MQICHFKLEVFLRHTLKFAITYSVHETLPTQTLYIKITFRNWIRFLTSDCTTIVRNIIIIIIHHVPKLFIGSCIVYYIYICEILSERTSEY